MIIGSCKLYLYAPWVSSLKEKRMVIKSLIEKTRHKFNISMAEVGENDTHKTIVIAFAFVTNEKSHADSIMDNVLNYIENNTEAVIESIETELL
jgi:uncharacterized protein YlxP (DUF503 family)